MKKLLLSLGALSAVVAPVAAVVACGSTTDSKEVAKQVELGTNEKVFVLGFTFGLKASQLNEEKDGFAADFVTKLAKSGAATTVAETIKTTGLSKAQKDAGYVAIASTGIDVISKDGKDPVAADQLAVIKAQLKLAGLSDIFSHVQGSPIAFKDVTTDAIKAPSKRMFTTTNKFAVVNTLTAVMFVA